MSKIRKSDLIFIRTTFMILLTLLGFMVGFAVGRSIYAVEAKGQSVVPQIRIVPKESQKPQGQYADLFLYEQFYVTTMRTESHGMTLLVLW